jgi:beta-galactosidase
VRVDPARGLLINDEVVLLRGACVHADNGPLGAAAIARAEERKVERLKEAGFNAVRAAHHPMSSAFLDACDRLGMYVIDEAFDVWTRSKSDFDDSQTFLHWWERDLEAMVAKDVNHPSVIMYSIGNEIFETGSPDGGRWSRLLAEELRDLDPTRLVTNGVNLLASMLDVAVRMAERTSGTVSLGGVNDLLANAPAVVAAINDSGLSDKQTEESFAVLDVAGLNYAEAGYAALGERWPSRVVLGTESHPREIDRIWALVRELPYVIGDFTWTGWDYLGEVGIGVPLYVGPDEQPTSFHLPFPARSAGCADLDLLGNLRTQGAYRQTVFGLRTAPVIAVHRPAPPGKTAVPATAWRWSDTLQSWDWPGQEGKSLRVEVYADADEIALFLNDEPLERHPVGSAKAFLAEFDVAYEPGTLTAVAFRDGTETSRSSLVAPQDRVELEAVADRTSLQSGPCDLAFVDLLITDGQGVLRTARDLEVQVTVSGAGILQALGSAAPLSDEGFTSPSCRTYEGRALAIVRPTGPGDILLTVQAPGCDEVVLELKVG